MGVGVETVALSFLLPSPSLLQVGHETAVMENGGEVQEY